MNEAYASFRDLLLWGWASVGHCGDCGALYPADVRDMAARRGGDRPIKLRLERRQYTCTECPDGRLDGVVFIGKVRRDGTRRIVEIGHCPPLDYDKAYAHHHERMKTPRPGGSTS